MQCGMMCKNNDNCGAAIWDECNLECSLLEKDGLLYDEDKVNSIKVLVGQDRISSVWQSILE